jgi:flagellar hook-length control protein FliK
MHTHATPHALAAPFASTGGALPGSAPPAGAGASFAEQLDRVAGVALPGIGAALQQAEADVAADAATAPPAAQAVAGPPVPAQAADLNDPTQLQQLLDRLLPGLASAAGATAAAPPQSATGAPGQRSTRPPRTAAGSDAGAPGAPGATGTTRVTGASPSSTPPGAPAATHAAQEHGAAGAGDDAANAQPLRADPLNAAGAPTGPRGAEAPSPPPAQGEATAAAQALRVSAPQPPRSGAPGDVERAPSAVRHGAAPARAEAAPASRHAPRHEAATPEFAAAVHGGAAAPTPDGTAAPDRLAPPDAEREQDSQPELSGAGPVNPTDACTALPAAALPTPAWPAATAPAPLAAAIATTSTPAAPNEAGPRVHAPAASQAPASPARTRADRFSDAPARHATGLLPHGGSAAAASEDGAANTRAFDIGPVHRSRAETAREPAQPAGPRASETPAEAALNLGHEAQAAAPAQRLDAAAGRHDGIALAAPPQAAPASTLDPIVAPLRFELSTPVDAPRFRESFAMQVSLLARDGVQHAHVHLNPAELGPISVQIALDGQQAQIHFAADSAQTRQLVEAGLPTLAAALRESGLTLSGGGVSQHPQPRQGGEPRPDERASGARVARNEASGAAVVRAVRITTGRLDTYA